MKLVASKKFEKKYKKLTSKNPKLKKLIDVSLRLMEINLNDLSLETHKLFGNLEGLWATSCGYDCRIIFKITKSKISGDSVILLIDFGTHTEVY